MTAYLVDFENVKSDGLNGINRLNENDKVYIFYSVNADKITFSLHKKINESKAYIEFINVEIGAKNALDFQLITSLGYMIGLEPKEQYVIVSKDNGYGPVVKFWRREGHEVSLTADLTNKNMDLIRNELYEKVKPLVEDEQQAQLMTDYIMKYKTKQGLNNAIVKVYGTTIGGKLYKAVKPLITEKKGN